VERDIRASGDLHLLKEPMRCPVYMGMSGNPSRRGPGHKGKPDSILMGLFISTLRFLYKDLYEFGQYTFQLFHSVRKEDIGFLEVVASIMGSGFPWDGGLAYTYAGGRPRAMHEVHQERMRQAAEQIRASGNIEQNVQDSEDKIRRLQELLDYLQHPVDKIADTIEQNQHRAQTTVEKLDQFQAIEVVVNLEKWFEEYEAAKAF